MREKALKLHLKSTYNSPNLFTKIKTIMFNYIINKHSNDIGLEKYA